jgi:S-formylglutathione hydrolase FrmB
MSTSTPETIVGVIPALVRRKGFMGLGAETFNLIVTPGRLVFAAVSSQTMKEAIALARQQAREQGAGAFGQFAAQQGWVNTLAQQYATMPVEAILARFPGSFCAANAEIGRVRLSEAAADDDAPQTKVELTIETAGGKHKFELTSQSIADARRLLQQTLAGKVK